MSVEAENIAPAAPVAEEPAQVQESAPIAPAQEAANKRFDFRHPVFLSSAEWRKIRAEVEEFTEALGALLSTYLRVDFGLQLAKLDTIPFNDFTAGMPSATQLTVFKLEPLRGVSVLEIRPSIGLGFVDRMLGGPGKPATLDRHLTEMEVALMDQLVQLVLNEWCKQWKRLQELRGEILGHENSPKFLQSSGGDTIMLVVTLEARMGECTGPMQLAVPYTAFEPILTKLTLSSATPAPAGPLVPPVKWNRNLDTLPIQLKAQWPAFRLTARDLMKLKPGEILPLQAHAADHVELRLGKLIKFRGRLGTREQKWAVQITEISKL
jgi:flagellar motor switch protein FliM